jgi:4-amino-4-deoxy-L-arabinose transferase-like glycosyltransferase
LAIESPAAPVTIGTARPTVRAAAFVARHRVLGAIVAISAALGFWNLPREGYGNLYYAAAVRSMLDSWHNLFYSAFDPGGYLAIDKPPLGFALQALSARLFGFSGVALMLPQVLAQIGAVALLYALVRRSYGATAAALAALALALTPVAVATARNNTIDAQVVLLDLAAVWATLRACERGSGRWLVVWAMLLFAAFLVKLGEAFLVMPGSVAAYLCCAPLRIGQRLYRLALACALLSVLCGAWVAAIDAAPATHRPYILASTDNSEVSIVLEGNGIRRLMPSALWHTTKADIAPADNSDAATVAYPALSGSGNTDETGPQGLLRLLGRPLAGQIAWLLPLAFATLAAEVVATRKRPGASLHHERAAFATIWVTWLLIGCFFFSMAGFFHRYYLVIIAPPVAIGAGVALARIGARLNTPGRSWRAMFAAAVLLATCEMQALIVHAAGVYAWLIPLLAAGCGLPALILLLARYPARHPLRAPAPAVQRALYRTAAATLFCAPLLWSLVTVAHGGAAELPFAGPDLAHVSRSALLPDGYPREADPALIAFLQEQHGSERYWLGTFSTVTAAPVVLALNEPVMAIGGFIGGDPTIDAGHLRVRVRAGEVRFFLLPDATRIRPSGGEGVPAGVVEAVQWVRHTCTPVPDALWRSRPDPPADPLIAPYYTFITGGELYDCRGAAPPLS